MELSRILFFSGGSYVYGKEKSMLSLMKSLNSHKFRIHCVINGFSNGEWSRLLGSNNIEHSIIKLGRITRKISIKYLKWNIDAIIHLPFALLKFKKILNQFNPNIVFFDSHIPFFFLSHIIKNQNTYCIIRHAEKTQRDFFFNSIIQKKREIPILHVAISNYIAEHLQNIGVPSNQIIVIQNGFEFPQKYNKLIDTHSPKYNLGYIGQITEGKGVIYLLESLKILNEITSSKYTCLIAGDGDPLYIDKLHHYINQHNLKEQVIFSGYLKNIESFYNAIDICIMPTLLEEAFGRVAAEAGLHKKVIIASALGALPEVIIPNVTGFLVPARNALEIAEKVKFLMSSPELIRNMGESAYNYISSNFNLNKMTDKYETILSKKIF